MFEPLIPKNITPKNLGGNNVDLLLRQSRWQRIVGLNIIDGPYAESHLQEMKKSLSEINLGYREQQDKDPVGLVVFVGGKQPRVELVCLDPPTCLAKYEAQELSFVSLSNSQELADLFAQVYYQSLDSLKSILAKAQERQSSSKKAKPSHNSSNNITKVVKEEPHPIAAFAINANETKELDGANKLGKQNQLLRVAV
jgi:hypothetical protein